MSTLFKIFIGLIIATGVSASIGFLSLIILGYIINIFKLNYGKDAYWAFSYSFYVTIAVWIICFALSIILLDKTQ